MSKKSEKPTAEAAFTSPIDDLVRSRIRAWCETLGQALAFARQEAAAHELPQDTIWPMAAWLCAHATEDADDAIDGQAVSEDPTLAAFMSGQTTNH